jgi:hypothetical protein
LEGEAAYDIWPPQYEWSLRKRAQWVAKYRETQSPLFEGKEKSEMRAGS